MKYADIKWVKTWECDGTVYSISVKTYPIGFYRETSFRFNDTNKTKRITEPEKVPACVRKFIANHEPVIMSESDRDEPKEPQFNGHYIERWYNVH